MTVEDPGPGQAPTDGAIAVRFGFSGTLSEQRAALAVVKQLVHDLEAVDILEASDEQLVDVYRVPADLRDRPAPGPTMSFGSPFDFALLVGAFVAKPVAEAIVEEIVKVVWERAAQAIRHWRASKGHPDDDDRDLLGPKLRLEVWFGIEQVLVTIENDRDEPLDSASALTAEALRRATRWLHEHGVTHRYLTYRVRNGQLSNVPMLESTPPPPFWQKNAC